MSLDGNVSSLAGTCPGVSFRVEGRPVVANGATTYKKEGCSSLRNGVRVKLTGTQRGTDAVVAGRIDIKKNGNNSNDDEQ